MLTSFLNLTVNDNRDMMDRYFTANCGGGTRKDDFVKYIVNLIPSKSDRTYDSFDFATKAYGTSVRLTSYCWLLYSTEEFPKVYRALKEAIEDDDSILVSAFPPLASHNPNEDIKKWLDN